METNQTEKKARILVVDDEITILRLLKINLNKNGYEVHTASNGQQALDIIDKDSDFDLVLLDVMMPEMSGYQVCRTLREKHSLYELPIMFVTAKFQVHDIVEGFDIGANDYILKPFEFKELLARTKTLVNLHRLTQTNERLEKINELTDKFHMMTIHDLKNPLTSIFIRSEFIENQLPDESELNEHISSVRKMANIMLSLINDYEEIGKIESGKLVLVKEKVSLNKLIEEKISENTANSKKKDQTINFTPIKSENDFVNADKGKLGRVIDNLLSNAIKYSPLNEGIDIRLEEVGSPESMSKFVRFIITDNGQGLTEEDKKNVFGRFNRLSARPTGGESSAGLGLSIAKELIEMHDGKIWVESREGEGSSFSFELPLWSEK